LLQQQTASCNKIKPPVCKKCGYDKHAQFKLDFTVLYSNINQKFIKKTQFISHTYVLRDKYVMNSVRLEQNIAIHYKETKEVKE